MDFSALNQFAIADYNTCNYFRRRRRRPVVLAPSMPRDSALEMECWLASSQSVGEWVLASNPFTGHLSMDAPRKFISPWGKEKHARQPHLRLIVEFYRILILGSLYFYRADYSCRRGRFFTTMSFFWQKPTEFIKKPADGHFLSLSFTLNHSECALYTHRIIIYKHTLPGHNIFQELRSQLPRFFCLIKANGLPRDLNYKLTK